MAGNDEVQVNEATPSGDDGGAPVELPKTQADTFMRMERLDGIGPARFGTLDQLKDVKIKVLGP